MIKLLLPVFVAILLGSPSLIAQNVEFVENNDQFGRSIAVGDFNGDRISDLAVAAPNEDQFSGAVFIYFGSPDGIIDSFEIISEADSLGFNSDQLSLGYGLASGDFNNDNFSDLVIGAPNDSSSLGFTTGSVAVLYGSGNGLIRTRGNSFQLPNIEGSLGYRIAANDMNGDEIDDVVISTVEKNSVSNNEYGIVYMAYGSDAGLNFNESNPAIQHAESSQERSFGQTILISDFNADGFGDLVIGIPSGLRDDTSGDSIGKLRIYYGNQDGYQWDIYDEFSQNTLGYDGEVFDYFGWSLSSGDFNGDGFADLAVGSPRESSLTTEGTGIVDVIFGSLDGLKADGNIRISQGLDGISTIESRDDLFGIASLSGDFDSDGYDDLVISAPGESVNAGAEGLVHILYGNENGIDTSFDEAFSFSDFNLPDYVRPDSSYMGDVLGKGDFNQDGLLDLVVGSAFVDLADSVNAGAVFVFYNSTNGFSSDRVQILHQSLPASVSIEAAEFSLRQLEMFPNPASKSVNLKFEVGNKENLRISISDNMGRQVFTSDIGLGEGNFRWNAVNNKQELVPSGIYFLELSSDKKILARGMSSIVR